jgi:hypothetical protein
VRVDNPATQAALDEIGDGVKNFAQLLAGARNRLSRAGVKPGADIAAVIAGDLLQLAWGGFLAPLWKEA